MKIFKLFYTLLYANRIAAILGFALLMVIAIPMNLQFQNNLSTDFVVRKTQLAIFNTDEGNPISEHLEAYLEEHAVVVSLEDDPEVIADAFYNEKIHYALTIPTGFGDALLEPSTAYLPLEKTVIDSQIDEAYVEVLVSAYLTNLRVLSAGVANSSDGPQINRILSQMEQTLANEVELVPTQSDQDTQLLAFGSYYTHYASYILTMTFITVFGYVITSMRQPEIVKRDRMSQMTQSRRLVEILLGCLSFSLVYWLFLMATASVLYGRETLFSTSGLLIILSSFIATFGIQAMAYFIVTIAPNRGAISFLATIISLFVAFASGLFAPREFIAQPMQSLASLATPIWQVKADEIILGSNTLTTQNWHQLLSFFGIQLLLALAYYALSFVIHKYRQLNSIYVS